MQQMKVIRMNKRKPRAPGYNNWCAMKTRCYNPNVWNFQFYGARGITVCDRWRGSFVNFMDDMGEKPSAEHSIERIDNDGDYEPGNCFWATTLEQGQNTRKTRRLTHNGETHGLNEWARILGITHGTLKWRLDNWSLDKALTEPPTPSKESAVKTLSHGRHVLTVKEWSHKLGMPYSTLCYRLRNGLSIEQIIERYVH